MNTFGNKLRISIFGESHGAGIGAVIDGIPAGIPLTENDFLPDLARRKSGAIGTTPRRESDLPHILSGVFQGLTTGAPLAITFTNDNTRSSDYDTLRAIPRPGHADYVAFVKWDSHNDPRGGGHFSGRITLPLVAAGVIAKKILHHHLSPDIQVSASLIQVGGIPIPQPQHIDPPVPSVTTTPATPHPSTHLPEGGSDHPSTHLPEGRPDHTSTNLPEGGLTLPPDVIEAIRKASSEGDSLGGIVQCTATNLPIGLGEPFFGSVESLISHIIFSIPGVRGIEFGDGFSAASMRGSQHNDPIGIGGKPLKNGAGGVNGGITNGADLVFRTAFKPTSSIGREQTTLHVPTGKMVSLKVPGRHDVCFALRTPVIVEAATAFVLADLAL